MNKFAVFMAHEGHQVQLPETSALPLLRRGSRESLDYRLTGSVALSSGFLRRIPFDERGSVKF